MRYKTCGGVSTVVIVAALGKSDRVLAPFAMRNPINHVRAFQLFAGCAFGNGWAGRVDALSL
jgi:hypothetical protein